MVTKKKTSEKTTTVPQALFNTIVREVKVRQNQDLFRTIVLSNYASQCIENMFL